MIKNIRIKNFKIFKNQFVELSNLTLITGLNSSGKSTFIQSILLLRQSYEKNNFQKLLLNDETYVTLGNAREVLNSNADNEDIEFDIDINEKNLNLCYRIENRDNDYIKLITDREINWPGKFEYISANRLGANQIFEKSSEKIEKNQIGKKGEYTAHYLSENLNTKIENEYVLHKDEKGKTMELQVNAWLKEISPGYSIGFEKLSNSFFLDSFFKDSLGNQRTQMNVGFGLSYVLPVIVSLLKATPGDLLIIENPEAHIHPKGQRKLGEFISSVAASGVQIIVETHSDHVLNGIRLSIKNGILKPNLSNVLFFEKDALGLSNKVTKINIKSDGTTDTWPSGFFDEWDNALERLLW